MTNRQAGNLECRFATIGKSQSSYITRPRGKTKQHLFAKNQRICQQENNVYTHFESADHQVSATDFFDHLNVEFLSVIVKSFFT